MCAAPHLRRAMLPRTAHPSPGRGPSLYRVRGSRVDLLEEAVRPSAVGWAFARKVLWRGNPTSIVSAAPGVDPEAIYHHCDDAVWLFRIRAVLIAVVVVAAAWRWPRPSLVWLGVLAWWALPLSRTVRWVVPAAGLAVATGELWSGHHGTVYWLSPGYVLPALWGIFVLDALAARIIIRSIMRERDPSEPAPPRAPHRQSSRLKAIIKEHTGNRVTYCGDKQIVGAGEPEWTAPTSVKLAPPAQKGAPRPFTPDDLLGHIQAKLKTLRVASGTSYAIPRLEVEAVLVAPVGHKRAEQDPTGLGHRHIVNRHVSGEPERVYVRARAVLWDGQVVPSVYVGAVPEGEMLRFIFLPYILHPIGPELSSAKRIAEGRRWLWLPTSVWHGLRELCALAQNLHRALERVAGRIITAMHLSPPRLLDIAPEFLRPARKKTKPVRALRELYADETGDMHMLDDAARFIHILRVRVYDEALAFLHEHGIDIAEFKAQVQSIINTVTVNGDISGSGVQIIAANEATGNTNSPTSPKKSEGKQE
jgi:hypothetical protein